MFPATGPQVPNARAFRDFDALVRGSYFADLFDLNAVNATRQARNVCGPYREEQLEVFAAVQRELQRIERATAAQLRYVIVDRQ